MAQSKEERNRKARERMAEFRKTEAYRQWLIESRDRRRQLKEKYRRQSGVPTVADIAERKKKKQLRCEERKAARQKFKSQFIGPPKPGTAMSDAEYAKWRYKNDGGAYQKAKREMHIACVSDSYVAQQLGMPLRAVPDDLLNLKREQILFRRAAEKLRKQIKEVSNGK